MPDLPLLLSAIAPNNLFWFNAKIGISSILLVLCGTAIWFYCYAIYAAALWFSCSRFAGSEFQPPISILKPICGCDGTTYSSLASFCQQDYPSYQIIFGIQNPADPSLETVQQLIRDFPSIDIQVVICNRNIGTNFKVNNLASAATKADFEILLIADSDIKVSPNYLQQIVQPLANAQIGVVTCPYRSVADGWITQLEALSIATEFQPGVFVSNQLEGTKFAMGSTILIRQSVLSAIGGLGAIANYLADDFQIGYLATQAGYKVALSHYIVNHVLTIGTLADSFQRQTRWMRGIRISRPWGYAGLLLTYGTVTSLLFLLTTGLSMLGWTIFSTVLITRLTMAWIVGVTYLNDSITKKLIWFVPIRDFISFAFWCYGFVGNTVEWRGRRLSLEKGGKLLIPVS
jgi:ceramide glucosyltransferase